MARARNFTLTCWPEHGDWPTTFREMVDDNKLRFAAWAEEICPSTNKKHYQSYVVFHEAKTFSSVKKKFPKCHIELMKGSIKENEKYCSKEGVLTKYGEEPAIPGERSDLTRVIREMEQNSCSPMKIARTSKDTSMVETVVRHYKFFKELHSEVEWETRCKEGFKPPDVYIRLGEPGVGKSRYVWEHHDAHDVFPYTFMGQHFDGYNGQPVVLFEDVEKGTLPELGLFKRLLDGYPMRVSVKCSSTVWRPSVIYITSNHDPFTWFDYKSEHDYPALKRRIRRITRVFKEGFRIEYDRDNGPY